MELWKDISGFEGIYQVSNLGRVKSLKFGEKILKPGDTGNGYLKVILFKNKRSIGCKVHLLVAHAFIPYIPNKNLVNHKDGNLNNNSVNNLEWCTHKENIYHSRHVSRNGAVISKKKLLHLYNENKNKTLEQFVDLVITNMR
jgi:hypothetical protein